MQISCVMTAEWKLVHTSALFINKINGFISKYLFYYWVLFLEKNDYLKTYHNVYVIYDYRNIVNNLVFQMFGIFHKNKNNF